MKRILNNRYLTFTIYTLLVMAIISVIVGAGAIADVITTSNAVTGLAAPVANDAAANKAYVDASVSAAGSGGVSSSMYPVKCRFYDQASNTCTPAACGAGYTDAGTVGCVNILYNSANGYLGGYCERWCASATQSGVLASAGSVVLFESYTSVSYNAGKTSHNTTCNTNIPLALQGKLSNIRPFVSYSGSDQIRSWAVYGLVETSRPVYAYNTIFASLRAIANSWADLFDANIPVSLDSAETIPNNGYFGTNSDSGGQYSDERYGQSGVTDANWLQYGSDTWTYTILCAGNLINDYT